MSAPLYLALLHHPVRDAAGGTVTTAVTNLDVHDIARSCRTYGVARYFLVTPIEAQQALVQRILGHWREGSGGKRIPARAEALRIAQVVPSLEDAMAAVAQAHGTPPRTVATAARAPEGVRTVGFDELSAQLADPADDRPWLLLFGTGHGLTHELLSDVDAVLAPIRPGGYNHLSVRAAVAIALDRLVGEGG